MANADAWNAGVALAERNIAARRERKEALTDEERQFKVQDLYTKGHALAKLIPSMTGDKREEAMKSLADVEANIRNIYHPSANPGALQKDWHWLAGMIHKNPPHAAVVSTATQPGVPEQSFTMGDQPITLSATPAYTTAALKPAAMTPQQQRRETQREEARKQAEIDVMAAGPSPQEEAEAKEKLEEDHLAWQIDWAKRHGITGEALDELTEHLAGVPTIKSKLKPLPSSKPYKGSDGRWYQSMQNTETGAVEAVAMPEGYTPPPPASGPVRAWKKNAQGQIVSYLLDRLTNKPIPGSENTDILPPPYLTQRLSTGMYHYVDEDNQVHEIPESRTSGPALLGGDARASSRAATAPATPRGPAAATPAVAGDRIIGTKGSAPLNKARSSYADAVKIANLADDVVKSSNSEKDALFVLALIRSEAGRVNAQEIASLFNAGGITEAPERWAAKVGHGELPQTLRKQLQEFTHSQKDAAQAAVDALKSTPADLKKKAKANVDAGLNDDEFLRQFKQ